MLVNPKVGDVIGYNGLGCMYQIIELNAREMTIKAYISNDSMHFTFSHGINDLDSSYNILDDGTLAKHRLNDELSAANYNEILEFRATL